MQQGPIVISSSDDILVTLNDAANGTGIGWLEPKKVEAQSMTLLNASNEADAFPLSGAETPTLPQAGEWQVMSAAKKGCS